MILGLFSNSITDRTLLFQAGYVTGKSIKDICLLSENHSLNETFPCTRETIYVSDNIEEIASICDAVVFSEDKMLKYIPPNTKTIKLRNPWGRDADALGAEDDAFPGIGIPRIAILYFGTFTDVYYVEIAVGKTLSEYGARVYQKFSRSSSIILSDLAAGGFLNPNINNTYKLDADIAVISVDCSKYKNDAEFISDIYRLSPSLIFICVDGAAVRINELRDLAQIICKTGPTIRSPYITYDVGTGIQYPVFIGSYTGDLCISSISPDLEAEIKKCILEELHFPSGIKLL